MIKDNDYYLLSEKGKFIDSFLSSLYTRNIGIWKDIYGDSKFIIKNNFIKELYHIFNHDLKNAIMLISPLIEQDIREKLLFNTINCYDNSPNLKNIISIGSSKEHNTAKIIAMKNNNPFIITIPIPLSNDSFATNRYSPIYEKIGYSSKESIYPSLTIIDLSVLLTIKQKLNIIGIGEAIGLYYSMNDFFKINQKKVPMNFFNIVYKKIQNLMYSLEKENLNVFLKKLAICLILKCLIMRTMKKNNIGAGGDHLISYALEIYYKNHNINEFSHGKLVYLGSIVMASLFPEWERENLSLKNLIIFGINNEIINHLDLCLLQKSLNSNLLKDAIQTRPNRITSLSLVSKKKLDIGKKRIMRSIRDEEF